MSYLDKVSNQILKTKSEKKLISLWEELTEIKQNTQDPNDIIKIESVIKEVDMKMLQLCCRTRRFLPSKFSRRPHLSPDLH